MFRRKLTREQRDGLSDIFSKIGIAAAIAAIAGAFVETKLSLLNAVILVVIAVFFITMSIKFRGGGDS